MIYAFKHRDAVLEFNKNRGRVTVQAIDSVAALRRTRQLFSHIRDETVKPLGSGTFVVDFKVALNYRMALLKTVERAARLRCSREAYGRGRFIDRYIVALICRATGTPQWLAGADLKEEIGALRKAAVVAREVATIKRFVDWDIVIYNYIELNFKAGHRSRVVREVRA